MNRLLRGLLAGGFFGAAAGTYMMLKRRRDERMRWQRSGYMRMRRMLAGLTARARAGRMGNLSRAMLAGTWLLGRR
ncbi:MAG: hypothetical protein GX036_05540 [Firmicutes bacterium]|jgi:hypothetical protein|nr:hypothetical protein [Bacillota bacterium]